MAWLYENEQTEKIDRQQKEMYEKFEVIEKTIKRPNEIISGIAYLLAGMVFLFISFFVIYSAESELFYFIFAIPLFLGSLFLLYFSYRSLTGNNIYMRSKHRLKKIGIPCEMRVDSIEYYYYPFGKNGYTNDLTLVNYKEVEGCLYSYVKKRLDDDIYEYVSVGDRVMVYVHPKNPKKFFVDFTQILPPLFDVLDDVWE